MTQKEENEISIEEVTSCPCCGHAVVVRGSVTRYYVPVSDAKLEELKNVSNTIRE